MENDPTGLIRAAFNAARESGKPNWHRMTAAVLKNRMLTLSNHRFSEATYGATTFVELLSRFPDLVLVDRTTHPPTAQLVESEVEKLGRDGTASTGPLAGKVRSDLWEAALNFTERRYVWDDAQARARPAAEGDDSLPTLSGLDPVTMRLWRSEFAAELGIATTDPLRQRLDLWVERGSPMLLPMNLLGSWYGILKAHVVDHLRSWFESHQKTLPRDLFVARRSPDDGETSESEIDAVRRVVLDCVKLMTLSELSELRLPPRAVARSRRAR
jgi:hypothetical protein